MDRVGRQLCSASGLSDEEWAQVGRRLGLSPQQRRIVEQVLLSKTDKEIAALLGLSPYTVREYLKRIFARLGVIDRVGVAIRVFTCLRSTADPWPSLEQVTLKE